MPFLVHLKYLSDAPSVNTDDLSLAEWDPVRSASDAEWWKVMAAPVLYPAGAAALVEVCATHLGRKPPPANWLTPGNVLEVFEQVASDLPTDHEDSGVPIVDPKAGDGSTTTSSSSSSADSGGRRRSSGSKA